MGMSLLQQLGICQNMCPINMTTNTILKFHTEKSSQKPMTKYNHTNTTSLNTQRLIMNHISKNINQQSHTKKKNHIRQNHIKQKIHIKKKNHIRQNHIKQKIHIKKKTHISLKNLISQNHTRQKNHIKKKSHISLQKHIRKKNHIRQILTKMDLNLMTLLVKKVMKMTHIITDRPEHPNRQYDGCGDGFLIFTWLWFTHLRWRYGACH